jgi:hypothetical protein
VAPVVNPPEIAFLELKHKLPFFKGLPLIREKVLKFLLVD